LVAVKEGLSERELLPYSGKLNKVGASPENLLNLQSSNNADKWKMRSWGCSD
jgi:hypothetical protein